MQKLLESSTFLKMMEWDRAFHQSVNASLDLTIDYLGKDLFRANLAKFKDAMKRGKEKCLESTVFPCSFDGGDRPKSESETDCLWKDSGCGYKCLDQVAMELGIDHT